MSKFTTIIPISIQEVKEKLPPAAYIHSIKMGDDKASLVMTWESELFRTKYDCIEFSVEALKSGNLPKEVTLIRTVPVTKPAINPIAESVVVGNKDIASPPVKRKK